MLSPLHHLAMAQSRVDTLFDLYLQHSIVELTPISYYCAYCSRMVQTLCQEDGHLVSFSHRNKMQHNWRPHSLRRRYTVLSDYYKTIDYQPPVLEAIHALGSAHPSVWLSIHICSRPAHLMPAVSSLAAVSEACRMNSLSECTLVSAYPHVADQLGRSLLTCGAMKSLLTSMISPSMRQQRSSLVEVRRRQARDLLDHGAVLVP